MNSDDPLVNRYRASAEDIPVSNLDRVILTAARRRSAARRFAHRARIALFMTAAAAIPITLALRSHLFEPAQVRAADYGKSEGATRSYLLNAPVSQYSGAGVAEGVP